MNQKKNLFILGVLALLIGITFLPAIPAQSSFHPAIAIANTNFLPLVFNPELNSRPGPTQTPTVIPGSQSDPFTFVSWADTKSGTAVLASLSNHVKQINPAFTLYNGDLESAGFTTSGMNAWKTALNGNTSNGIFDKTFPVRGNHDISDTAGWQSYFNLSANSARIGAENYAASSRSLTYAFDYKNAVFIGVDIPGDIPMITSGQVSFIDNQLTAAESRGLVHAFLFFHGPIYPVSNHTSCTTRACATPASVASLIRVLNKHAIVSAVFNGHEHLQAYVHMDQSRVPEITHPFEEFITGSAGAAVNSCSKAFRFDYCGSYNGFATIDVAGKTFTVKIYQQNQAAPVKAYQFTRP